VGFDKNHIARLTRRALVGAACMMAGGLIMSATFALADGLNTTQTVIGSDLIIPYSGYMMRDKDPLTGLHQMTFEIWDAEGGGNLLWSETQTVNIVNGRFSVALGANTSLTDVILDAERLWLEMTIIEADAQGNQTPVGLSGRQAIEPAHQVAWSNSAADIDVGGNVSVAGAFTIASKNLLEGTSGSTLTIAPAGNFTGGVTIDADFSATEDVRLGKTDLSGKTTIYGPDSDGVTAAVAVERNTGSKTLIDAKGLDSDAIMRIQNNNNNFDGVEVHGDLLAHQSATLGTSSFHSTTIKGADNNGATGTLILAEVSSDPFAVNNTMWLDQDEIDSDTDLQLQSKTSSGVRVWGDLDLEGNLTNMTVSNEYTLTASGSNQTLELVATGLDSNGNGTITSMCFLTEIEFDDPGSALLNNAQCAIQKSTNETKWELVAGPGNAGFIPNCAARCLSW